jgi:hypothetical protein
MTRNKLLAAGRQFAFDDVQIGPANAAGTHAQQNVTGHEFRTRNLGNVKGTL